MLADNESARFVLFDELKLLDMSPDREFDLIVKLAQRLTGFKIALITLVDEHRQWFKAKIGLDVDHTSRDVAFCDHTVAADDVLVIPDATKDIRFRNNPLVTGSPHIRFYAGIPIRAKTLDISRRLIPLGTLCVIDDRPHVLDVETLELLIDLAHLVDALIGARSSTLTAMMCAEERGRNLQILDRRNRQLRQAERMANIGSWRLTLADDKAEWSEQTYAIHGIPVGDGAPLAAALEFYPLKARMSIVEALQRTMKTGEPFDIETDFSTAQGEYRRVRSMGELEIVDGQPVAVIGVFHDITARFKMEEALRHAAHFDDLTRIATRGRFNDFVDNKIAECLRSGECGALLLIDLDHFKAINDGLGHHAGDEVLQNVASRLRSDYLSTSFVARLGGDEFVVFISDKDVLQDLPHLIGKLLSDLRYTVRENGLALPVSATIGASWLGGHVTERTSLLRQADMALYEAKKTTRGSAKIAGDAGLILPEQFETKPPEAVNIRTFVNV